MSRANYFSPPPGRAVVPGRDSLPEVVEALYDAALDEELWPRALKALADYTGSCAATLWILDGSAAP